MTTASSCDAELPSSYWETGFAVFEEVLSEQELAVTRVAVESVCDELAQLAGSRSKGSEFGRAVGLTSAPELGVRALVWEGADFDLIKVVEPITQADERLTRLWEHPILVGIACRALGVDEVAPFTDKFNAKRARRGGEYLWHQDNAFWYSILRQRARDTVTIMLALDATTEENGAMVVIPGTQHEPVARQTRADDVMSRYHADTSSIDVARATMAPIPEGGALVFGPFLLHRSGANETDSDRRALLLTYQPAGRPPLAAFDYEAALLGEQWMNELP